MSLTFRERRNPPSRRKSCHACTKAKRRCDFALPACMRCANRGITCEYPDRGSRGPRAVTPLTVEERPVPSVPSDDFLLLDDAITPSDPTHNCTLSGLDLILDPLSFPMDLVAQELPAVPSAYGSAAVETVKRYLQHGLDESRKVPAMMAKEAATPWSHHMLYHEGMPKSMRDAYSCCSMYSLKTKSNGPVVLRCIESYVEDLLRSEPAPTIEERLAHTQALLLYHIMRLLDGDLRSRAQAERQLSLLDDSADALLPYVEFDVGDSGSGRLSLHPLGPTKAFWKSWVLQESARRTLLFALYFLQSYRIVSGMQPAQCDGRAIVCRSVTVSSHLWYATSPVAFAKAWNERRFFVIPNCCFDKVIQEAAAEDVDSFGKMMLSSCMGVEEAEGWFAARGSSLWASGTVGAIVG